MKFTCIRSELSEALMNVQRAVSAKATLPALEGILIKAYDNKLTLTGYDLEIGITTTIDATISEQGEIVVGAKLFSDIVRKLPEEIASFESDERYIFYINSGNADYQIIGMSSIEYPDIPTFESTDEITLEAGVLKNMIRQTIYAVSDNMAKPIYTGSLYEIKDNVLRVVAIDGYRMAIRKENIVADRNTQFIVPGKIQMEILKLIDSDEEKINIIVGQRHVLFTVGTYSVISRLIEGTFLDYETTIPKDKNTEVRINTRKLISAVERMSLLTSERIQSPVKCSIGKDEIKLTCKTSVGRASDSLQVGTVGTDVEIGFNNRYLLDALKNSECDEVMLILNGSLTPMIVSPVEGDSFTFLVVPMRINDEN